MPTSTTVEQDQVSHKLNTPTVQPQLGVKPTSPIPIPKNVHTSAAQVSVIDANNLTSVSPTARRMFFHEEARKCYEEAGKEANEDEKPERPTTLPVKATEDKQARGSDTNFSHYGETYLYLDNMFQCWSHNIYHHN